MSYRHTSGTEVALAIIGFISLLPVAVVANGWMLSILWEWFIVTTFGVAPLTIPQALGISLVVNYFTGRGTLQERSSKDTNLPETLGGLFLKSIGEIFGRIAAVLAIGWILTHFL